MEVEQLPRLNPTTSSAPQVDVLKGHPSPESSRWPTPRIVMFPAAPHSNPKTKKANQCDSMPPSSPHVSCTSHLSPTSARKPSPSKPQQKKHCNNPTLRRGGWHHSPPALRQPRRCSGHMRLPWLHGSPDDTKSSGGGFPAARRISIDIQRGLSHILERCRTAQLAEGDTEGHIRRFIHECSG